MNGFLGIVFIIILIVSIAIGLVVFAFYGLEENTSLARAEESMSLCMERNNDREFCLTWLGNQR